MLDSRRCGTNRVSAVAKHSSLAPAILAAVKVLMQNGDYTKILTHWGIQGGAITNPVINGATS